MDWFLVLLLTGAAVFFSREVVNKFMTSVSINEELRNKNKDIKKRWCKTKCVILEIGINSEYTYPQNKIPLLPKEINIQEDSEGYDEAKKEYDNKVHEYEKLLKDYEEKKEEKKLVDIFGNTKIKYEYEANGVLYHGRRIAIAKREADTYLAYKLRVGDKITVWYDPESPEFSCLRKAKKNELENDEIDRIMSILPYFFISVLIWMLVIYEITNKLI